MHADGRADQVVVEEMLQPAGRGLPADVLHLSRLRAPVIVGVALRRVVVVPGFSRPRRVHVRIEGPVRQVDALDRVGERAPLQRVGCEPEFPVPPANAVARLVFADLERQHALRPERILGLLVRDQLRRPAELAALCLSLRIQHRDRLAALAFHVALFRLPPALVVGDAAQRGDQVVFDDPTRRRVDLRRRRRAAERADQRLLGRIPDRFRAACRTGELVLREGFGHAI